MYSFDQLRRGLERGVANPRYFAHELNRLYHRRLYLRDYNTEGVDVVDEDWDNLFILDACRHDAFEERHELPGRLERRRSRGSHTVEFLEGNFAGRTLRDTVYVTASPQQHRWRDRLDAQFHAVVNVWQEAGWDEDHETVLPETVKEQARKAHERYPDKRLIVHFLQPHYPFIGASDEVNARTFGEDDDGLDIWGQLRLGETDVSAEDVRDAYLTNLDLVLPEVEKLLDELPGRTVVTADHGNMFGERSFPIPIREWGHPRGMHTDELVEVPWLVYDEGPRKEITEGSARADESTVTGEVVEERLKQLGYAE